MIYSQKVGLSENCVKLDTILKEHDSAKVLASTKNHCYGPFKSTVYEQSANKTKQEELQGIQHD